LMRLFCPCGHSSFVGRSFRHRPCTDEDISRSTGILLRDLFVLTWIFLSRSFRTHDPPSCTPPFPIISTSSVLLFSRYYARGLPKPIPRPPFPKDQVQTLPYLACAHSTPLGGSQASAPLLATWLSLSPHLMQPFSQFLPGRDPVPF